MKNREIQAVVAGHICLDIFPDFRRIKEELRSILTPGRLINVGPASVSTGGCVANTGLALHRLGVRTRLIAKVGKDTLGDTICKILRQYGEQLAETVITDEVLSTSYSIVISPPDADRTFLHHTGANDAFKSSDVPLDEIQNIPIFHFGYPPAMKKMYTKSGSELKRLFVNAKKTGSVTSLDMAKPEPDSEAGRADWRSILDRALPYVDIFLPSFDEIAFMLGHPPLEFKNAIRCIVSIGEETLRMGAGVAVIKLGDQGLYLRTSNDAERLKHLTKCGYQDLGPWTNRELLIPCFRVKVAGTTGAGDSSIAGFLSGMLHRLPPEGTMQAAVAVGACCVENVDATSGIPDWVTLQERIQKGWKKQPVRLHLPGWRWDDLHQIWVGPNDRSGEQA
ncbi:MAG: carbohydrate kinase family protein [bacterium]